VWTEQCLGRVLRGCQVLQCLTPKLTARSPTHILTITSLTAPSPQQTLVTAEHLAGRGDFLNGAGALILRLKLSWSHPSL
jgi:hypothetical protein